MYILDEWWLVVLSEIVQKIYIVFLTDDLFSLSSLESLAILPPRL